MLYIHTSHQLETLSLQFSVLMNRPLAGVFTPEMVVVQNAGMARYLSMQLADTNGISANIEYLFPAEFMWKLLRLVSPDIPEKSQCTPDTMRFHIMDELSQNGEDYPELQHYITQQTTDHSTLDEKATWDLSCQLSQVFDQYLFYRSDWIREWEAASPPPSWQARLWSRCVKDKRLIHWLNLQDQFKNNLQQIDKHSLPERISFFSMSALSPGYIELIGELAHVTDIHFFLMNPCEDVYWGDLVSEKTRAKQAQAHQAYAEVGHPLLASMGKQGRDFIHQLLETPTASIVPNSSSRVQPQNKGVLHQLQDDIHSLSLPQRIKDYQADMDHSIRINACHTPMREVEVLYDQILDALENIENLSPADIVVMMPDVEKYAPYIDAIFSPLAISPRTNNHNTTKSPKPVLPYSIADKSPSQLQSIIDTLLQVFELTDKRFDVESVFEIVTNYAIQAQFSLDQTAIEKCRDLAKSTNIRWGISAKERQKAGLPDTDEHTWKYALDRLLLGYMMGDDASHASLFPSNQALPILPYTDIEGSDMTMLASFKRFTDTLFSLSEWQQKHQTLQAWINDTQTLLQQLFSKKTDLSAILANLSEVESHANLADFKQTLSFTVFKTLLKNSLLGLRGQEKYLGHGITFCALVPMRSVPFKVVALLGMNDNEFPRQDKHVSFDLMKQASRSGDRSRRDEDRYLFLESLLATRTRLLISYMGQSIKDNTELPPSVLVSELLESLQKYTGISPEDWVCKHPLQAFSQQYFSHEDNSAIRHQASLFSYAEEYAQLHHRSETTSKSFIQQPLAPLAEEEKKVSLQALISFYQNPARAFLLKRFSIPYSHEDPSLPVREPFALEPFKDREIRQHIKDNMAIERTHESILISRAKGELPYGDIGEAVFQQQAQVVAHFLTQLPDLDEQEAHTFSLPAGKNKAFTLQGKLTHLTTTGRVMQQLGHANFRDYIDLWLHHLVLNTPSIDQVTPHSYFYSPDLSFSLAPIHDASEQLDQLIDYYWQGLHFPLAFFPKSAFALYKTAQNGHMNTKNAIKAWKGDDYQQGESKKFEYDLLHRDLVFTHEEPKEFLMLAKLVFGWWNHPEIYTAL